MSLRLEHLPADVHGLSPLSRSALAERPRPSVAPGLTVPRTIDELPRLEERFEEDERADLAATLEAACLPFEPHVAVLESARKLATPGACIMMAGQQPGLFGGPLYNLWKAVHVIRLAREAERAWGVPVVPGFWNHADDHDVTEVHHAWVQNNNLDLQKVVLAGLGPGKRPIGGIRLDQEAQRLSAITELLHHILGDAPRARFARELFAPRDGESLADGLTRMLFALFGDQGLLVIDPNWIRTPCSRALAQIVGVGPTRFLQEGADAVFGAGHTPAIDPSTAALVFHHVDGERQALRAAEDGFRYDGEPGSRTAAELAAEIVQEPENWSAGALLRPIVQDLALPVAAYVGGWGELAYHAELPPLRRAAGAPLTAFLPRLSVTLVDADVDASLEALETDVAGFVSGSAAEAEPEETALHPVASSLRTLETEVRERLGDLETPLTELDPGLVNQLRRASRDVGKLFDRLTGKIERVHANAQGRGRRHERRLTTSLKPRDKPQERVRTALEVIARNGTDWLAELIPDVDPFPTEHLVVHLPPAGDPHAGDERTEDA